MQRILQTCIACKALNSVNKSMTLNGSETQRKHSKKGKVCE